MKKSMKRILPKLALGIAVLASGFAVSAREATNVPQQTNSHVSVSLKTEAGDCVSPSAQFDLEINNVRARLLTGGDAWWNFSEARYEVPKTNPPGSGPSLNAIFAGAIWISGKDAGGNLKCAAQRYRQGGDDYWPGPLDNSGNVDKTTCTKYDRHFNVFKSEIDVLIGAYLESGSVSVPDDKIAANIKNWPGKGNPFLIQQGFNINTNLAPFRDVDGDGSYDPRKGDYPSVYPTNSDKCGESNAVGDQMVFSVFNDVGNIHTESNGQGIGVQVNSLAFAFQTTDEINNMTFYRYEIINKSPNDLFQTYVSQWVDADLGNFGNDRVGCDVARSLGYTYNATANDVDNGGVAGYGTQLPMTGIDFFEGPVDTGGNQLGLSSFVYFTNGADNSRTDPSSAAQYRNYQTCLWNDGTPFTEGGIAYNSSATQTCFIFPGNPAVATEWSECQPAVGALLPAGDRRFVQTSGPFTLTRNTPQYVTVGSVFVRPPGNGVGLCPDINTTLGPADDKAQALFDQCFKLLDGPDAPTLAIREMDKEIIINLVNLAASNNYGEKYDQPSAVIAALFPGGGVDTTFTFEGYKIFQLANARVSATDLDDPEKAKLVAQVDVKNGVTRIINYERDGVLGLDIPVLKVDGLDNGITYSYKVTDDLFASGVNQKLVNHKTYYFTAVAYAYNEYKKFDQNNPQAGGQLLPYLQGRGNFKVYSAIPHISDARNSGTSITTNWGEGLEVQRIEGQGNGGNEINLTPATIDAIINSGATAFSDTLTYVKGDDPIGFKVIDPIALKEAKFELRFVDTIGSDIGPSTSWMLLDLTNGDTVRSERKLDRPYEQVITATKSGERIDYGFSLTLGNPVPEHVIPAGNIFSNAPQSFVYDYISGSVEFENPLEQWLSFLADEGNTVPSNWIRSGTTYVNNADNPLTGVYDDNWYYTFPVTTPPGGGDPDSRFTDSTEVYEKVIGGTWAPYCLAANYASKTPGDGAPAYVYGPGFKWRNYTQSTPPQNTLDKVASVEIVITPDKSKWSKCVVFETGEDEGINEGSEIAPYAPPATIGKNARKGQLRMHLSKEFDANQNLVETPFDTGRSYFPGYAINVETGERLNIAFGESSDQGDQNGRDMLWNPTTADYGPVNDLPIFGGKHFIYVMSTKYDEGRAARDTLYKYYNGITGPLGTIPPQVAAVYRDLMWTSIPLLSRGYSFVDGYIPPMEARIHIRVEKPFERLRTVASGVDPLPRYQFSTVGLGPKEDQPEVAKNALDLIRAVPNPYLAYSYYESDQNSGKVKITNLPNECSVTIMALDGTIIRRLSRAISVDPATNRRIDISDGSTTDQVNLDNSLDWDLKNDKGLNVSSGMYLIHVEAPGLGERTIKWFGAIRPADTSNF
jgi:hypothetical protein